MRSKPLTRKPALLNDAGFVMQPGDHAGVGVARGIAGEITVSIVPLRLSYEGQGFAADLQKPGAVRWIRDNWKQAALKGLDAALRLALGGG